MTRERSDLDLGALLDAWMNDVAPDSVPVPVLEEAFARTMSSRRCGSTRGSGWPAGEPSTASTLLADRAGRDSRPARRRPRLRGARRWSPASAPVPSPTPSVTDRDPVGPTPSRRSSPSPPALVPATPIVPTASVAVVKPQSLATDGKAVWVLTTTGSVRSDRPGDEHARAGRPDRSDRRLLPGHLGRPERRLGHRMEHGQALPRRPGHLNVAATIPVGLAPKGVLATGRRVWVADTHDGKVYRIDPKTNKIVATITVGPTGTSGPNWLASGLGSIWVDIPNNQTVVRIDAVDERHPGDDPDPGRRDAMRRFRRHTDGGLEYELRRTAGDDAHRPGDECRRHGRETRRAGLQPRRHRWRAVGVDLRRRWQSRTSRPDLSR